MTNLSNTQNIFEQDLSELVKVRYIPGNLFSKDNGGNEIGVRCFFKGEPNSIAGNIVTANVIRADGSTVPLTGAIYGEDNNIALVNLVADCYEVPGVATIVIKLTGDYRTTTIGAFITNVYVSETPTVIDPGTVLPSIQSLISSISTAVASIPAGWEIMWQTFAPAFSTSTTYTAGQYVTYGDPAHLYKFTSDHTAGAWNSSHVTMVSVGSELSSKSDLRIIAPPFYDATDYVTGQYVTHDGKCYKFTSDHPAGAWNSGHVTEIYIGSELSNIDANWRAEVVDLKNGKADIVLLAPAFYAGTNYVTGQYVTYSGKLYRFTSDHTAGAWNSGHVTEVSTGLDLNNHAQRIDSLSEDVDGLNEDVGDLRSAFNYLNEFYTKKTEINLSAPAWSTYIDPSTNKWKTNGSTAKSLIISIADNSDRVVVTANNIKDARIAFLTSNSHTTGDTPSYCQGTGLNTILAGTTQEFYIPNDATYLYIQKVYSATVDRTPSSAKWEKYTEIPEVDDSLTVYGDAADAKITGDAIDAINNLTDTSLPFTTASEDLGIKWSDGTTYTATNMAYTSYVNVSNYKKISYRQIHAAIATKPTHGMAFYDENKTYITGYCSYYTEDGPAGYIDNSVQVPTNAKYARFTFRKDTNTYGDFWVKGENVLKGNIVALFGGNHEESIEDNYKWLAGLVGLPQKTNGKFNVAARMRMLCDIEWTPIQRVPRQINNNGTITQSAFTENVKQKGIPYGAQLKYEQWMGRNISFETFLSALANPNSVMYDFSRVGTAYRQSAWYSVNCSKAVGWALNIPNTYASGAFSTDPHINLVATAGHFTANDIHIGDIIEKQGVHTAIVTDLVYNSFGDLSQIEVSEAVTPTCRRKRWNLYGSFENFWTKFDGYYLLRYDYVDDVPPVNMESMYPYISASLGLNYGNKSNYATTDTIEITILKKVSNTLVVKKNGEQITTIDVSSYEQSTIVEYTPSTTGWYEIGFDGDEERNNVGFCVNNNVATFDSSTNKLTFSSSESTLYMVSYSAGSARSHLRDEFPTATDLANGYMTLTVPASADYIHVTFANDYGKNIIEIALS